MSAKIAKPESPQRIYRHRLPVRLMHWINVLCLTVLLGSGLNIFNAHPNLYWGKDSSGKPWLAIGAVASPQGPSGVTVIAGRQYSTNGVLGAAKDGSTGAWTAKAFPSWATIPGPQWLAAARNWHLFFAWLFVVNGIGYVAYGLFSGHLRRDLIPSRAELRGIGQSLIDHLRFRHPTGAAASRYNVLQSLTYLLVIFGLLPLVVVAGMALSPRLDTLFTGWVDWLGGRQSARSLHFLAATGLLLFVLVHVFEVLISGVFNQLRSMITGYYTLPAEKPPEPMP